MPSVEAGECLAAKERIGPLGRLARLVVGALLLGDVAQGHVSGGWRVEAWLLALVVFPCVAVAVHAVAAHRHRAQIRLTSPLAHALNVGVFVVLWGVPQVIEELEAVADATLIFYGASMLLAAARAIPGCEVTVVSNWVLGRRDCVGCALFHLVDAAETARN